MFRFKQFSIHQQNTAMKVTTDGCLFGAWVTDEVQKEKEKFKNILDIGAGTGLLSLMIAQQIDAAIDAVEIDQPAYEQAAENFEASPWKEKLKVYHTNITDFNPGKKYDLIISNPPFFENDLRSSDAKKNAAKHDTSLTLQELLKTANALLSEDGNFAVLLPYHRSANFISMAMKEGLFLHRQLNARQTPSHDFFRSLVFLNRNNMAPGISEIKIKASDGNYTAEFVLLLKEYYLYL